MKSLVVDDDLTSRLVLEDILARFGVVHSCADGTEAVRAGLAAMDQGDPYDLICMDIMMPTMSGLEALQAIRQEEERRGRSGATKVIVITAREDSGSVSEAFLKFCDAYVVKPVDIEAFLNVLECVCEVVDRDD